MVTGITWSAPLRRAGIELIAASFVVLFQELALIRWLPSQVRVLAYFPNIVLISAFLGLGLGCLLATRRSIIELWPTALVLLIAVTALMGRVIFTHESASEYLWLLYYDLPGAAVFRGIRLPILVAFFLSAAAFIPLGQYVARRLRTFREAGVPLWGYVFDICGSLLGVIGFALMSFLRTFPVTWFAAIFIVGVVVIGRGARLRAVWAVILALLLVAIVWMERSHAYSPYYALQRRHEGSGRGFIVLTNGSTHQFANAVTRSDRLDAYEARFRDGYHLPYRLLGRPPGRVLILGAGTGNDVAVALDEGASHVDAVEIDPTILEFGRRYHPNRPYSSPRVRAINADARAVLNAPGPLYDLIVFGTLDSLTRLSALSNVRLDNFVYTRECFEAAARRLAPGGGIIVYFGVGKPYIDQSLVGMLTQATGDPPVMITERFGMFNRIYMAGPAFRNVLAQQPKAKREQVRRAAEEFRVPSDDWPYLYLERRAISRFYLSIIATIALSSLLAVFVVSPDVRRAVATPRSFDAEMFLFGLAFLLLETKSVTEMSLVWGATWLTNAVVFGSILAMILSATLLMEFRPIRFRTAAAGLIIALLFNYLTPPNVLVTMNAAVRLAMSLLFVGAPIFFAAICFALLFAKREAADAAFGWNLLGAVCGGLLEFSSMAIGIRNLALLALAAYLLAILISLRRPAVVTV